MTFRKAKRKLLFGGLMVWLVLSACGISGILPGGLQATATPTPTPASLGAGSTTGQPAPEDSETPEDHSPTGEMPQDGELDSCLVGTWRMDQDSFVAYLDDAVNVSEEVSFDFQEVEGDFLMEIGADGVMAFTSVDPLHIVMSIGAGGISLTTLDMYIVGEGSANWLTYQDVFVLYGQDFDFSGDGIGEMFSGDMLGTTEVQVTLTPEMLAGLASNSGSTHDLVIEVYPDLDEFAAATYSCEGDTFTYQFDDFLPAVWYRE